MYTDKLSGPIVGEKRGEEYKDDTVRDKLQYILHCVTLFCYVVAKSQENEEGENSLGVVEIKQRLDISTSFLAISSDLLIIQVR